MSDGGWVAATDEYNAARAKVDRAIKDFIEEISPGEIVMHWVLVVHKTSIEMERNGSSCVGVNTDDDISFVEKRGLVEVALDSLKERN